LAGRLRRYTEGSGIPETELQTDSTINRLGIHCPDPQRSPSAPGAALTWFTAGDLIGDLLPLLRSQAYKFKSGASAGSVANDGDRVERVLLQEQVNRDRFSDMQCALHQRTYTAFTDVQADAMRRLDAARL
jgi:hypothetical protein